MDTTSLVQATVEDTVTDRRTAATAGITAPEFTTRIQRTLFRFTVATATVGAAIIMAIVALAATAIEFIPDRIDE